MKKLMIALLAAVTFAAAFAPQSAEAQHHRRRNNGAPIAAGIAAGLLGAVVVGSLIAGSQRRAHAEEAYVYHERPRSFFENDYPHNRRHIYAEQADEVIYRQPRCFIKRAPLYDEYGQVAAYQNRRVCE